MHRRITLSALVCAAALSAPAMATTYPLTLTDTSGQTLTLQQEPKRIVVQDGRDILTLALLDRANPFDRLVARNNLLKKSDAATGTSCKANGRQRKHHRYGVQRQGRSQSGKRDRQTPRI